MATTAKSRPRAHNGHPGRLEYLPLGDLVVLRHLQRTATDTRLRGLRREGWNPAKQGILLGAELTDGEHKGEVHVIDGGTRRDFGLETVGPDYEMPVYIEPMTEAEAAFRFDVFNGDSRKPSALDHYTVGLVWGNPPMLALKRALDAHGLIAGESADYGNGEPGEVAAVTSCIRIITGAYRKSDSELTDEDRWNVGSDRLIEVLEVTRDAYEDEDAHDGDMLQAVARLRALHGEPFSDAIHAHLVTTIGGTTAGMWRSLAQQVIEESGSQGGSVSRSIQMSANILGEHNRTAEHDAKLTAPSRPRRTRRSTS